MSKALVVHPVLNLYGGGEVVAVSFAKALIGAGFKPFILTTHEVDRGKLESLLNLDTTGVEFITTSSVVRKLRRASVAPSTTGRFRKIKVTVTYKVFYTLIEPVLREFDLVVDTKSNIPYNVDITYIHYPAVIPVPDRSLIRVLYDGLAEGLVRLLMGKPRVALANSTWTALKVYQAYKLKPIVVYPPVRVEDFAKYSSNDKRGKVIMVVSRFDPTKRVDRVLDAAERLRDYTFIIAGNLGWYSPRALRVIREKIKAYKLDNIVLKPMLPRSDLAKLLGEARFYLHPELPEHFGISVVEAMSAGAIPIVYKDGGAWTDIVSKISPILGYKRIEEAADIVRWIEGKPGLLSELREKSVKLSWMFNYDRFEREVQLIAKRIVESKRR